MKGKADVREEEEDRPATGASEAAAVVGLAESADYLTLDELEADVALGAVEILVALGAVVVAVLAEEAAPGQRVGALAALEAVNVEVLVLNAQHLARDLLLAGLANGLA